MIRKPAAPEQNVELAEAVARLLNRRSRENVSDTPDWLLARIMVDALVAFEGATNRRDEWSGFPGLSERLAASLGESPDPNSWPVK